MEKVVGVKSSPLKRIKYLMLMQLGDMIRAHKNDSRAKKGLKIFLQTVLAIGITAGLIFAFSYLKNSVHVKISSELFISLLLITQLISILSCVGNILAVLYTSKDNSMLLAFPCTYSEIFVSKLGVFAIAELKKSCFFTIPFFISYGIMAGAPIFYWLFLIPFWLVSCLLPVAIGALLSIPCIYIKRFLEKHLVLYAGLIISALVGAFVVVTIILSELPDPLRLVAIYSQFISSVEQFLVEVSGYALWYVFIGKAMFGEMVYLYFPLAIITFALLTGGSYLLAKPFYFKAVSSTVEAGRNKVHKPRHYKHNSLFLTFFRKEMKLFFRNSQKVNSAVFTIFLFPLVSYVFNFVLVAINQNILGEYLSVAFNVMITLSILSTNNATSAMAISTEGNEFAVLKAAPSNTSVICWAKIAVTELVNIIAILTTVVVLSYTTTISVVNLVLIVVLMLILTTAHIMWSFQIDILKPKILEYATKGNDVINNPNVALAMVIGFIISTVAGFLVLILLMDHFVSGWIRILLIALGFMALRWYFLKDNIKVYFNEIQM